MTIRDIWREAAMRDQLQFYGHCDPYGEDTQAGSNRPQIGYYEHADCAMTILPTDEMRALDALATRKLTVCPVCQKRKVISPRTSSR